MPQVTCQVITVLTTTPHSTTVTPSTAASCSVMPATTPPRNPTAKKTGQAAELTRIQWRSSQA
jgi:hypothetical protein